MRQMWAMETKHFCHSGLSLHILGGGWTKAHDPRGREYDDYTGKARTKKVIEICRWSLSFRNDWAPHGEVNAQILNETWIDKMRYFFDIYTNSQDPAYMFEEEDFTFHVEPPALTAMMEAASEFTLGLVAGLCESCGQLLHSAAVPSV